MEDGSPPAVPPDPFDLFFPQHQGSTADDDDASPSGSYSAASNYSSCDGEGSELDRYCSANSALGSASLCSSVGNYGDLLDFPDAASWERLCKSSDEGGVVSPRERGLFQSQHAVALLDRMGSFPRIRIPSRLLPEFTDCLGESRQLGEVEGQQEIVSSEGGVVDFSACDAISAGRDDATPSQSSLLCKIARAKEVDLLGNLGSSSPAENRTMVDVDEGTSSEGENSMFEYGTDCENSTGHYGKNNSRYIDKLDCDNINPLVMNSSVAFGSDDLDELLQENGSLDLQCLSPVFQPSVSAKVERNVPSLSINHVTETLNDVEKKENAIDHYEVSHKAKFLQLENTVESQSKSMHKVTKGDIRSITNGTIVNVDMHGVADKRMLYESCSTDHYVAIQSSSVSASVSQSEKSLHQEESLRQEHDNQRSSIPVNATGENSSFQIELNNTSKIKDLAEDDIVTDEIKKQDAGDLCDEMVLEMEEILLDTRKSSGSKSGGNHEFSTHQSHHVRDGSSTASTSGTDDIYAPAQYHSRIDWVEVIGAKQRVGDVSFGERLVGVKEYTIYIIRVLSANDQWEVERRYRDFFALYQQLRTLFSDHGLSLPSQWASVDRESMKIFGNVSPVVVSKRSALIQDCLRSVLNSGYSFGLPGPLLCFLSPGKMAYSSSFFKSLVPQSLQKIGEGWNSISNVGDSPEDISELGKTISLVVDIKPHKSMQQLLELQHYTCAGCHKHMDAGKTLLRELVQTLAWKKPRYCEYTSQLFCSSCHTNDTSVVPAKVLHLWDFSLYPVSQLAKAYLESIYDQPMLCVSAMNPFLFSKVPALLHIMGIRKRIAAMFPYIRCPFRISIQRGLGSRRHLLESNDFFALRDLVDLSKGAFAALPIMLETVSNKILEHITQQCLVCYDSGAPCAARQFCDDALSLIFPFQEAEAARCSSCDSIFHKPCFVKMITCPCGKPTSAPGNRSIEGHGGNGGPFDGLIEPSHTSSTSNLFSNILLKARPDRIWKPRNRSPVILMGSLPNTPL